MFSLLSALAMATPPEFATVSDPVSLLESGSGTWPRLFPREDGSWHLIMSNGGDLYRRSLHADLSIKDESRHNLTHHQGLTDHALAACDDGGYIDAASSYTSDWDDTLTIFRWDEDFNLINQYILAENSTEHRFADAAIICEEDFTAVGGFMTRSKKAVSTTMYRLDPDTADVLDSHTLIAGMTWFGAAWAWDGSYAYNLRAPTSGNTVAIETIDPATWTGFKGGTSFVELTPDKNTEVHWFVRTLSWGDHWLAPFILLDPEYSWEQGSGNLHVAIFDASWSLLSTTKVTHYEGGAGATQPWINTDGEVVVVSWNNDVAPYGATITLTVPRKSEADPDTGGSSDSDSGGSADTGSGGPSDSGVSDSGGRSDTETGVAPSPNSGDEGAGSSCGGCSASGGLSTTLAAVLLGLLGRRRSQYTAG